MHTHEPLFCFVLFCFVYADPLRGYLLTGCWVVQSGCGAFELLWRFCFFFRLVIFVFFSFFFAGFAVVCTSKYVSVFCFFVSASSFRVGHPHFTRFVSFWPAVSGWVVWESIAYTPTRFLRRHLRDMTRWCSPGRLGLRVT